MSGHFLFVHVNLLAPRQSPDTIPISEATILAHLKHHGFSGQILEDFADAPLRPRTLAQTIQAKRPLALGFTAYQENIEQIRLWARFAKRVAPDIKVILGGPQVTFMPGEALRHMPEVDYLCRGEGEEVMLAFAQALAQGQDTAKVPGLCLLRDGIAVDTGFVWGTDELDTYASAYLTDSIDLRLKDRAILLTSRGCAYDCAFCYTPKASGRRVRFYSIGRIIEEMTYLKSKGMKAFWFADTNFSVSRKRLVSFLEAIIQKVPGITFWCQTRYDLMDRDLLVLLKRAGADNVAYGLESANPGVLKKIEKPIDLERLSEVIRMTQETGMNVELFSMYGLPGETLDQALQTLSFVQTNGVAVSGNSISQQAHLFFGTPMSDDPDAFGIHVSHYTRPAYLSVCRDYETDAMSAQDIRRASLIWRVNRNDLLEDIHAGRNLFHRAAFITEHYSDLTDRPEAGCLLSRIYLTLEEYGAAAHCMKALSRSFPESNMVAQMLRGPFRFFKKTQGAARHGFQVIYDCQGSVQSQVVPATCGRFQEAIVGESPLLTAFEKQLVGIASGGWTEFGVTFPVDYGQKELAGKAVMFRVHVHYVKEPFYVNNYEELFDEGLLQNEYGSADLDGLRQHNINLYYLVLHGAARTGLVPQMPDALMLINLYLKLGFFDRAKALSKKLPANPVALSQQAQVFRMNNRPETALELLDGIEKKGQGEQLLQAQAFFDLGRLKESEGIAEGLDLAGNIQLHQLRVQLAGRLALPVKVYLDRQDALLDARISAML